MSTNTSIKLWYNKGCFTLKKLISVLFLLTLTIVLSVVSASAKDFTDVKGNEWYAESVSYVFDNKLMLGTSENRFSPLLKVTRAQMAQILWNLAGNPSVDGETDYVDVQKGKWYNNPIDWVSTVGVMTGYGNQTFGPDDSITREQLAKVLHNYTMYLDIPLAGILDKYTDAKKISSWAVESMSWAVSEGLISGTSGSTLNPRNPADRAQLAKILKNYCENVATEHEWPAGSEYFKDFEVVPTPEDLSIYENDWEWLCNDDLYLINKTDKGYVQFKFIGSLDVFPTQDTITLTMSLKTTDDEGNEVVYNTPYAMYPGKEYTLGFPYGPGEYSWRVDCDWKSLCDGGTVEVTEEDYEKSSLASLTMCNYISPSMVQLEADRVSSKVTTDEEKAHAIFDWFCKNTEYDATRHFDEEFNWGYVPAYNRIIEKGGAICKDFAGMYVAMCRSQGIKSRVCVGYLYKGAEEIGYHALAEVFWGGEWHTVDPTIAASSGTGFSDLDNLLFYYDKVTSARLKTDYMY